MKRPSREISDMLGGFLQRHAGISGDEVQQRLVNAKLSDSSSTFVVSGAEAAAFPEGALLAMDLPPHEVRERLGRLIDHVAKQVRAGELPRIDLPDLHRANAIFDARGNVFLGHNVRSLPFDRQHGEAFMRLLLTLETAADNLQNGVCTTKRGLFYQHRASLPHDTLQVDTDRAIASLANVLRVRRKALGFVEAPRGVLYGRLVIRDGKEVIDLAQVGPAGRMIPRFTDDVEIVSSDAKVIVILEKLAVAHRLAQARWWDSAHCIMVCGEGFPSVSTREFVRKLIDVLGIRAVICADADPDGIRLALTYAHGSILTALETPWLACNDLSWVGLCPSDIDRYCQRGDVLRFHNGDADRARALLDHPSRAYVNDRVRDELAILVEREEKVELDALVRDTRLLEYLQHKLESDLIKL